MNPANWKGAPTVFGSQRTSFAAKAVALDSVSGAVASTPVIAAMVSVWRTFFNIVPFAGARAEVSPAMWAGTCVQAGGCFESCRLVRARQRGREQPTGLSPDGYTEASSPSAASAHTRVRGFDFALPFLAERDRTRPDCIPHLATRRYLKPITARSRPRQLIVFAGHKRIFRARRDAGSRV
jgi:hypothetical protein